MKDILFALAWVLGGVVSLLVMLVFPEAVVIGFLVLAFVAYKRKPRE